LPLVIHTQAWSSPREEGLHYKFLWHDDWPAVLKGPATAQALVKTIVLQRERIKGGKTGDDSHSQFSEVWKTGRPWLDFLKVKTTDLDSEGNSVLVKFKFSCTCCMTQPPPYTIRWELVSSQLSNSRRLHSQRQIRLRLGNSLCLNTPQSLSTSHVWTHEGNGKVTRALILSNLSSPQNRLSQ
jgi:hypothetical protein